MGHLSRIRSGTIFGLYLLASIGGGIGVSGAQETVITYRPPPEAAENHVYPQRLLAEALNRTADRYGDVRITQAFATVSRDRSKVLLEEGRYLHVMAEVPRPNWETDLIPIYIPLRKGLQGYRLFFINRELQPLMDKVETLDDLRRFSTGSGAQWSTTLILENAGFDVVTGHDYETMFDMFSLRRFQTFSRGINEIFFELDTMSDKYPDMYIETGLALHVPLPVYFFVTPTKPKLAERIELGLREMIADGSFDKLFMEYHGDLIRRANLANRKIFRLENPNLSNRVPLENPDLWY